MIGNALTGWEDSWSKKIRHSAGSEGDGKKGFIGQAASEARGSHRDGL